MTPNIGAARSRDIESGNTQAPQGNEGGCCNAVAHSLGGAIFGAMGGATTGCIVKLGQLALTGFDHDISDLNTGDLVLAGAVFGVLSGGGYGFLVGLRGYENPTRN
ncbi:MAG: hypothetical protein QE278_06610 [Limnobacter sp.]|nr:hypothetical protein [Limnobacter sp.]